MPRLIQVSGRGWEDNIIAHLKYGSIVQVLETARLCGEIGSSAIEPLIWVLKNSDRNIRWRAAIALNQIGPPAVSMLIGCLGDENDTNIKPPAIWALGHIGDKRAVEPLMNMLSSGHTWTRWMSIAALIMLGDQRGLAAANIAIKDEDEVVRGIIEELIEGS